MTQTRKTKIQDLQDEGFPQILLLKLIANLPVSKEEIYNELYEVCDRVHASCDDECPVYFLNGHDVPDTVNNFEENRGCDTFKSGKKMYEFIQKRIK